MFDRQVVTARVPDAVAFEERFEVLPCTVAPDCDAYDATSQDTIEFVWTTPTPTPRAPSSVMSATASASTPTTSKFTPADPIAPHARRRDHRYAYRTPPAPRRFDAPGAPLLRRS